MSLLMPSVSFSKATAAIVRARMCRWPMPQGGAINVQPEPRMRSRILASSIGERALPL